MIRMIQASNADHAKAYFKQALSKADYYINDQELNGQIRGKLAERLGITGIASKEAFYALCDNIDPATGKHLTPRTKAERTTGYDINFHCPKSVSILHALSDDDHLMKAFEDSVQATMRDIEADAKTRVRKDGQYDDRQTGELVWADFVHQTARPVDGHLPDPHLHAHCFVFNATWDADEQRVKAGQFRDIKRDMPYYQSRFHKYLSDNLIDQGYGIRRTEKSFEIENVPEQVIDLFSKRTDEIGRIAKEKGITDIDELGELGARTRAKKQPGVGMNELRADWRRQIRELEPPQDGKGERIIRNAQEKQAEIVHAKDCVDHALQHSFERASVVHDRRLLESAYRQSIGHRTVALGQITDSLNADQRLMSITERGQKLMTTKEVLSEEHYMVKLARGGQGKLRPLYAKSPEVKLDGQQGEAVKHLLTTTDRVSIIRGTAGSGKTTLMQEAIKHMEEAGKTVTVVAPTSEASRGVLRKEGFAQAETVSQLLVDKKMQEKLKDQVLWVDEAGLLGTKDMTALLDLATKQNARLILGGDTRQHSSVVRGDALRILNTVGEIKTAEVSKIYRQRDENYRKAVEDLSAGNVKSAFEKLDASGAIKEIDPLSPNKQLIDDYMVAIKSKKTALVISPTHQQAEDVTDSIRQKLRSSGELGKREITIDRLVNRNLTEAQRADWRNISEGNIIQFNQNVAGIQRGSRWEVAYSNDHHVLIKDDQGETQTLPTDKSACYDIYRIKPLDLAKGDKVRITRNGFDDQDKRLNNGQLLQVASVKKSGDVELLGGDGRTKYKIGKDFGHINHAYCITSHASQGKTVDEVFISQPAATFPATSSKQLYVSVSRGRDKVHIYTDDKEELLTHAQRLGDRQSALELMQKRKNIQAMAEQVARERNAPYKDKNPTRTITPKQRTIDIDYEPRI
ncbi:relaxase domain-containing protein [Dyadobacter sp. CY261]|uniref:MobF family relaxase n=1 Tax=Dyadobacter sp. CY261 TaxID=2907203 RepID=UPI001F384FDD|nr:MobF family relaxase [Dyadobacter sp. CY261]MCF0075236.1 relaxase domain-containing protein [Dyadobacter sp. CY261]